MPLEELQTLLLALLSTRCRVEPASVADLDTQDWDALLAMARQHRLLPLLHWRLTRERNGLAVPQAVRERLAATFKRSALQALLMQQELVLLHRLLAKEGIPYLALKGSYLAFHAYPHPALRPMRDLDILVPQAQAQQAYRLLLDTGFAREQEDGGDIEAHQLARKHLPPLLSLSGGTLIELHTRLGGIPGPDGEGDIIAEDELWRRALRVSVAGSELAFMSATDLLLHLIDHAVYGHRFDNGPLLLSDLACLLEGHAIDWPLFWRQAAQAGRSRGALLSLRMVERYFGGESIVWPEETEETAAALERMIDTAALLTLRHTASRDYVTLQRTLEMQTSLRGKLGILAHKVFLPKREMAVLYPVLERSPRIYLWYGVRWWLLIAVRLPRYLRSRVQGRTRTEVGHVARLEEWLKGSS